MAEIDSLTIKADKGKSDSAPTIEPLKLGGILVRQPDIIVAPRTVTLSDGTQRHDPGGSIAHWQLPGKGVVQYTVMHGINTTVENDGLPIARAFMELPEKTRPTVNFFDYRGFGESKGITLPELRFGQMRSDAAAVLAQTTGPQILIGISMGGALSILRGQKEFKESDRFHAPRKVLAIVAVNAAYDFPLLDGIEVKSRMMMRNLLRDQPKAQGLTRDVADAFLGEARHHILQESLSPHGIKQPTIGCPILVIQGERDPLIPPGHSESLVRNIAAPAKLYLPLKGAEHNLTAEAIKNLVTGKIHSQGKDVLPAEWLKHNLRADRGWIVRQHVMPRVPVAMQAASVTAAQVLWKAAARAVVSTGNGFMKAMRSEMAARLRTKMVAMGESGMDKLLPPRTEPAPPANNNTPRLGDGLKKHDRV